MGLIILIQIKTVIQIYFFDISASSFITDKPNLGSLQSCFSTGFIFRFLLLESIRILDLALFPFPYSLCGRVSSHFLCVCNQQSRFNAQNKILSIILSDRPFVCPSVRPCVHSCVRPSVRFF